MNAIGGLSAAMYERFCSGVMVSIGTFEAGQFLQVRENWADRGAGSALAVFSGTRNLKFQFKYPGEPWLDLEKEVVAAFARD